MGEVTITKVSTKQDIKRFIRFAKRLYAHCPHYVPDMDSDIKSMMSLHSKRFETQAFLALDGQKVVGRVLAIISHPANKKWNEHVVRFGLFEAEDRIEVSRKLLNAVEEWGKARGMDTLQGPLGLTDFDKEGMLIEDFDMDGTMSTIYNPPYYPQHMEQLGMKKAADWLQCLVDVPQEVPERFKKTARIASNLYHLHIKIISHKEAYRDGWISRIFTLFNKAYAPLFGFAAFSQHDAEIIARKYLPLLDTKLMPVVLDDKGNLIGAAVTMGSLTHAMRQANGRLWPMGWLYLLKTLCLRHEKKAEMLLIGVDPTFQGLGVTALIFEYLIGEYIRQGYKTAETGPQLETNTKELTQWKYLNSRLVKRRRCYEKKFENTEQQSKDIQNNEE